MKSKKKSKTGLGEYKSLIYVINILEDKNIIDEIIQNTPNIINRVMKIKANLLFRNNSTGSPTKIHIINNDNHGSFCGFDDFCAQIYASDENDTWLEIEFCKKCLKAHINKKNKFNN